MSDISFLQAVKIQARAIVPVVKALERELGAERAHQIVGDAIAESWAEFTASRQPTTNTHPGDAGSGFDFPVERIIVRESATEYGVDMKKCAFAEYFRKIGEPEIGALLTCGVDNAVERKMRPDWEFKRSQTLMQGAPHCDFRWRRKG
jgi:hypothetical protein